MELDDLAPGDVVRVRYLAPTVIAGRVPKGTPTPVEVVGTVRAVGRHTISLAVPGTSMSLLVGRSWVREATIRR